MITWNGADFQLEWSHREYLSGPLRRRVVSGNSLQDEHGDAVTAFMAENRFLVLSRLYLLESAMSRITSIRVQLTPTLVLPSYREPAQSMRNHQRSH